MRDKQPMHDASQDGDEEREIGVPRWLQVVLGFFLGFWTILTLVGSITLVVIPNERAPLLAPVLGTLFILACLWMLEKCYRLVVGQRGGGSLLGVRTLRIASWCFLLMPVAGLFTGYFAKHTLEAIALTVSYVRIYLGLQRAASRREARLYDNGTET